MRSEELQENKFRQDTRIFYTKRVLETVLPNVRFGSLADSLNQFLNLSLLAKMGSEKNAVYIRNNYSLTRFFLLYAVGKHL